MSTGQFTYSQRFEDELNEAEPARMTSTARSRHKSQGWTIGGLVLLGLGLLAAYKFGPDLVRYIKIERM